MRYTYDVLDARGNEIETGFASEEEAYVYVQTLGILEYTVRKVEHYTTTGLGRDPDLH
jgi:hypothetical protein